MRRFDHLIVSEIEGDVSRTVELRLEEHEIPGLELRRIEFREGCELRRGIVRKAHAELRIDELCEPGTVEAGHGDGAAPDVRHPDVVLCDCDC